MWPQEIEEAYKKNHVTVGTFDFVIAISSIIILLICTIEPFFNLLEGSIFFRCLIFIFNTDDLMKIKLDIIDIKKDLSGIIDGVSICNKSKVFRNITIVMSQTVIDGSAGTFSITSWINRMRCNNFGEDLTKRKHTDFYP